MQARGERQILSFRLDSDAEARSLRGNAYEQRLSRHSPCFFEDDFLYGVLHLWASKRKFDVNFEVQRLSVVG